MVHLGVYLRESKGNSSRDRQREKLTTRSIRHRTRGFSVKPTGVLIIRSEKETEPSIHIWLLGSLKTVAVD